MTSGATACSPTLSGSRAGSRIGVAFTEGPRNVVIWCSNDYLGMGGTQGGRRHGRDRDASGHRAGGNLNIAGTHHPWCSSSRNWRNCTARRRRCCSPRATFQPYRHRDHRKAHSELPDPVGCAQLEFDDRGRPSLRLRAPGLPPQRHGGSGSNCCSPPGPSGRTDRLRQPVIHGRRCRAIRRNLRSRREVRRDDLCRRGSRGRHVWPARRRHRRARRRHASHRRSGRHACKAFGCLGGYIAGNADIIDAGRPMRRASSSPPRCRRRSARRQPPRSPSEELELGARAPRRTAPPASRRS